MLHITYSRLLRSLAFWCSPAHNAPMQWFSNFSGRAGPRLFLTCSRWCSCARSGDHTWGTALVTSLLLESRRSSFFTRPPSVSWPAYRSALCHAGPPASDAGVVGRGADQARPASGPACLSPPALRVAPSGAPQTPPSFLSHHFMWLAHLFPVSSLCPEEHQLFPRHSACAWTAGGVAAPWVLVGEWGNARCWGRRWLGPAGACLRGQLPLLSSQGRWPLTVCLGEVVVSSGFWEQHAANFLRERYFQCLMNSSLD